MDYKLYSEILEEAKLNNKKLFYSDQLKSIEWKNKRDNIILRDNEICSNCNSKASKFISGKAYRDQTTSEKENELKELKESDRGKEWFELFGVYPKIGPRMIQDLNPKILHVHHKYYIFEKLAWEYPDSALITLCNVCHQNLHNNEHIPVYLDDNLSIEINIEYCKKCNGSGFLSEYHYYHNGICFNCNGDRFVIKNL